jgi:hypothetical protein
MLERSHERRLSANREKSESNQEVADVGAAKFEVLCCSVCAEDNDLTVDDLLEDDVRAPGYTQDICIQPLEVCLEGNDQLFPRSLKLLTDPNIWIGDSGASVDMTPTSDGLDTTKPCSITVHVGNNQHTAATLSGTLSLTMCDNNGLELFDASFLDMHLVPEAPYNIISLTQRLENDWTLSGDKLRGLTLSKDGNEIRFDIRIETAKGVLWAGWMKRKTVEINATAVSLSIKQAHLRLGHLSEEATRKASKALWWKLTAGSVAPCEDCAIGKGRQKNLPKDTGGPVASLDSPRAYLDCSSFKDSETKKVTGVWCLMVFYPSQLKVTDIYKSKNAMVEPTVTKLNHMSTGPKFLRMDNAGENKLLADRNRHSDWKLPIVVEWTARDTPQQNSPVEVAFSTLSGRARAMLNDANIPKELRKVLMPEASKTATYLDGLIPLEIDGVVKTRYDHQLGSNPPFARSQDLGRSRHCYHQVTQPPTEGEGPWSNLCGDRIQSGAPRRYFSNV